MEKIIEIRNLTKQYITGDQYINAVDDLSLSMESGRIFGIIGPSGSGKSTLLTLLGGIAKPTSGSLIVDGIEIFSLREDRLAAFRREYIGFVFQDFQLIPFLNVAENVILPTITKDIPASEQTEKSMYLLDQVELYGKRNRLVTELSGGEKQRVAIARALMNDPPIVLADEPTGNLDSSTGSKIIDLFEKLNGLGKTIIIVTHNKQIAERTDIIFKLVDGKLEEIINNDSSREESIPLYESVAE